MPNSKLSAYIASPLGFTSAGKYYYYSVLVPALEQEFTINDPWALVTEDQVASALADLPNLPDFWLKVGEGNARMISQSDIMISILDGQELDSGTASEVGYAAALKKTVYGLRTDVRTSGELAMPVNLQVATFIHINGGVICGSLPELINQIKLRERLA